MNNNVYHTIQTGRLSTIQTTNLQLTSTSVLARQGVLVIAPSGNPSTVYIGHSGVNANQNLNSGFPLDPNVSITFPIDDPSKLYAVSPSGSTNTLFWAAL